MAEPAIELAGYGGALLFGLAGLGVRWSGDHLPNGGAEPKTWREAAGRLARIWLEASAWALLLAAAALAAAPWVPGVERVPAVAVAAFLGAALSESLTLLVSRPGRALSTLVRWARQLITAWRGGGA
jgi:hypothetical protein